MRYVPAKLCIGQSWVVAYWAWCPVQEKLRRKKIRVNRIQPEKERRKFAKKMIDEINSDLEAGWSPWVEQIAGRGMHKLTDAIETFLKVKMIEVERNSRRSYRSLTEYLLRWMRSTNRGNMMAIDWTKQDTIDYLDHLKNDRDYAPRTFNNYLTFCRVLFNWLVDREYVQVNFFTKQKKLKVIEKSRLPIPEPMLLQIHDFFKEHNPGFLTVCFLQFYTEVRPGEQCRIKVRDIDFSRQVLKLHATNTKNSKARFPTIPDVFLKYLIDQGTDKANPNHFLISTNYRPGRDPIDPRVISKTWDRMRKKLKIPVKYKFYSLRDNGITYMLENGVSPDAVMNQAGHSDLEMTTIYLRQNVTGAVQSIKDLRNAFE